MEDIAAAASSIRSSSPMFLVRDMRATINWYESVGFKVEERYEQDGEVVFARLSFGKAEFTLSPGGKTGPRDVRLWFFTEQVDVLYRLFNERPVRFEEELYEPYYGGRQFSIRDNNGMHLIFWQPKGLAAETEPQDVASR